MHDNLLLLQFGSIITTALMGFMLLVGRIHLRQTNRRYEISRYILVLAMGLYVIHYALQMHYGFRQQGDDIGAVINILFYTPIVCLISFSMFNIACNERYRRRFMLVSASLYVAILLTFGIGLHLYHSLRMPHALYVMALLFFLLIVYAVFDPLNEMRLMRSRLEADTAADLTSYDFFVRSGLLILYFLALLSVFIIFSTPWLAVIGPVILLAHFFYVVSFLCLGFVLRPVTEMMQVIEQEERCEAPTETPNLVPEEDYTELEAAIAQWQTQRLYSNSELTMASMARQLRVEQSLLSTYLSRRHKTNFRTWLSHIRLEEAKRLLRENPNLSNEVVAEECGFTSRTYFQNLFKVETGMTPKEWRMKQ